MPNPDSEHVDAVFSESEAENWLEDFCDDSDAIVFGDEDDWWDDDWWY